MIRSGIIIAAAWAIWPSTEVKERAQWASTQFETHCTAQGGSIATIDTNGANAGGAQRLCLSETDTLRGETSGRCWIRPNLRITNTKTGAISEIRHPDCI